MIESIFKKTYNEVLAQTISDSGKFLFIGNRFGDIFIQNIEELDVTDRNRKKLKIYPQGNTVIIASLSFHFGFLIVGTDGMIYGLKWEEDKQKLSTTRKWQIAIPHTTDSIELTDVNSLCLNKQTNELFAGCGDNVIYQINLEDGRIARKYEGHRDYIHCVVEQDRKLCSASEDGSVKIWSPAEKKPIMQIEPSSYPYITRPEYGKWIGSIALTNDWLICGGGPKLSLWHLRAMQCTKEFAFPGKIHCCDFIEDLIIVAGTHSSVHLCTLGDTSIANIPLEHTATYSLAWQNNPSQFMSIAGYSNELQILTDFRFLDSNIELYGNVEM